jgi:rod shape determining protein RodA
MSLQKKYFEKIKKIPITLMLLISLICSIGFVVLYSASGGNIQPWAYKQILICLIFLPIVIIIAIIDIKFIFQLSYIVYFWVVILLISVELFGSISMGAKRWIDLGFIRLQPSEPTKLAIVLMLARYFHQLQTEDFGKFYKILLPLIGVIFPALLIIKEPDLGTGVIIIIIASAIFLAAGFKVRNFIIIGVIVVSCIPVIWQVMHDYQKKRVMVFLNPEQDPLGAGYNIIQSKIAIGSGGLLGKGLIQGTQSHLEFLPEHQTDFIFATFAEEFGFVGSLLLLALYAFVIIISLMIAVNCRAMFSKLMVIGITAILFSHVFINIAMVMGLLPVVGVPLPFISYGGTMMVSMLIGFGLIMNAQIHQHSNVD